MITCTVTNEHIEYIKALADKAKIYSELKLSPNHREQCKHEHKIYSQVVEILKSVKEEQEKQRNKT